MGGSEEGSEERTGGWTYIETHDEHSFIHVQLQHNAHKIIICRPCVRFL